jgi:hypothetical protein
VILCVAWYRLPPVDSGDGKPRMRRMRLEQPLDGRPNKKKTHTPHSSTCHPNESREYFV